MSGHVNWNDFTAKLAHMVIMAVVTPDGPQLIVVCDECDRYVCVSEEGEAYGDDMVRAAMDHDCEDEIAQPLVLTSTTEPYLRDEDYEHISPVQDLDPSEEPTQSDLDEMYGGLEVMLQAAAEIRGDEAA